MNPFLFAQPVEPFSPSSLWRSMTRKFCHFLLAHVPGTSAAPLALLIDGDNISAGLIPHILAEVGIFGNPVVKRVYGNWSSTNMQRWREAALHYVLEQRHHGLIAAGKNATDIALVIDALDLLYSGVASHFCLVTSDSDYTPLVLRLRNAGCMVFVIGDPQKTPGALVNACTTFVSTERFTSTSAQTKSTPAPVPTNITPLSSKQSKEKVTPLPTPEIETNFAVKPHAQDELLTLLTQAYYDAANGKEREWILCSCMGNAIKKRAATFKPSNYGHKDLSSLFLSYTQHFELRRPGNDKERQPEVRLRAPQIQRESPRGSSSHLVL